jgi:hypothetical protein
MRRMAGGIEYYFPNRRGNDEVLVEDTPTAQLQLRGTDDDYGIRTRPGKG